MFYTLAKWALWLVAAALIGGATGWLLRGLRGQGEPNESEVAPVDIERLRTRLSNLEPVVAQRDRLRFELDECRATAAAVAEAAAGATAVEQLSQIADGESIEERDRLAALAVQQEITIGDLRARLWNHEARIGELQGLVDAHRAATAPPEPDLGFGATVLGEKVRLNDLTVVEGIGPKIADLCHTIGVRTWWQLANTDASALRTMLAEAGPRFSVHDPDSWPEQGRLLAVGAWEDFKALTDQLRGRAGD